MNNKKPEINDIYKLGYQEIIQYPLQKNCTQFLIWNGCIFSYNCWILLTKQKKSE